MGAAEAARLVGGTGEALQLERGSKVILDRHNSCGVVVKERYTSGQHCILHCGENGQVRAEDVSSNGTYINGEPIPKGRQVVLKHSDRLALTRRSNGWLFLAR